MISELIERAVHAVLANNREEARQALVSIDFAQLITQREQARDAIWKAPERKKRSSSPSGKSKREPVTATNQRATFERDHFTCRYAHCQRRTIHLPVLKALSALFPDILSYHSNWKPVEKHILYWAYSTSLEHKVSFPHGGTSAPENLITTCYQCNDLKNMLHISELGWEITELAQSDWDGLSQYARDLQALVKASNPNPPIKLNTPKPERAIPPTPIEAEEGNTNLFRTNYFIRAMLPGKKSRRRYRVDAITGDQATPRCGGRILIRHGLLPAKRRRWLSAGYPA